MRSKVQGIQLLDLLLLKGYFAAAIKKVIKSDKQKIERSFEVFGGNTWGQFHQHAYVDETHVHALRTTFFFTNNTVPNFTITLN